MAMEQTRARASWWRRLATVPVIVLLLVIGVLAFQLAPLFLAPNAYAGVPSIERSRSYQDPALLRVAWGLPVASRYGRYSFEFQSNQSVCGPASVANMLHSLGERSTQEQVLASSPKQAWFGYLLGGLTLDQLGDLMSRRTGRPVRILRGLDLAEFRAEMRLVNDPSRRVVANFHRGPLFGRGHGHISPVLAYLPDRDLVLVGDVNAEYRPFLVSTERFWRAVDTIDPDSGKKRGLAILDLGEQRPAAFRSVRHATKRQRP
jgi:hypothetical protein